MSSWPARYNGWCEICDDRIELDELITRFDPGYAHSDCIGGTWNLQPLPRKPLPLDWKPDGLELARAQVALYAAIPPRKSWPSREAGPGAREEAVRPG